MDQIQTRLLYILDTFNDCDILLTQEHWLYRNKLHVYKNLIDGEVHGISSTNADQLLTMRPYGWYCHSP